MARSNGDDDVMLLGHHTSPFVHRITWALKIKGVSFKYFIEDLENKSSMLLEYNPIHKKVPVLVHAGKPVSESLVILEYIDEAWPDHHNSLMPTSPYHRAMARFWSKYIDEKVVEALRELLKSKETEQALDVMWQVLKPLEEQLKGKKFFGGETIGFTDIVAGILSYFADALSVVLGVEIISEHKFPKLHAWAKMFQEVEIIKENVPEQDDIVANLKVLHEKFTAASD